MKRPKRSGMCVVLTGVLASARPESSGVSTTPTTIAAAHIPCRAGDWTATEASQIDFASRAALSGLLQSVRSGALARNVYSWGHFPIAVGLTLLGAGTELAILDSARTLEPAAHWALCGGVALYIVATCLIVGSLAHSVRAVWWPRGPAAVIVVALAAFGGSVPAPLVVGALATVLVLQVLLEIAVVARGDVPEPAPVTEPTTA